MIDLQRYKAQRLKHFSQVIVLNEKGKIIQSCDSIFSTTDLAAVPVYQWFPFLESIFESLLTLEVGMPELVFTKVEQPFDLLQGYYDFSFSKIAEGKEVVLLWFIYDYTALYQDLKYHQQLRNELEIKRQRAIQMSNLLHNRSFLTLQDLNEIKNDLNGKNGAMADSSISIDQLIKEVCATFKHQPQFQFDSISVDNTLKIGNGITLKLALFQLLKQSLAFFQTATISFEYRTLSDTVELGITQHGIPYQNNILETIANHPLSFANSFQLWYQPSISNLYLIKKILALLNGKLAISQAENAMEINLTFKFEI